MIVSLPWPPKELSPNARSDRRAISGIRGRYRDECFYTTRQQMAGQDEPARDGFVPVSILFRLPDARHRDVDNMLASVKSALDGMAMALRMNDRQFKPITLDWERANIAGGACVRVEVGT